jgi:hypothetical protein
MSTEPDPQLDDDKDPDTIAWPEPQDDPDDEPSEPWGTDPDVDEPEVE